MPEKGIALDVQKWMFDDIDLVATSNRTTYNREILLDHNCSRKVNKVLSLAPRFSFFHFERSILIPSIPRYINIFVLHPIFIPRTLPSVSQRYHLRSYHSHSHGSYHLLLLYTLSFPFSLHSDGSVPSLPLPRIPYSPILKPCRFISAILGFGSLKLQKHRRADMRLADISFSPPERREARSYTGCPKRPTDSDPMVSVSIRIIVYFIYKHPRRLRDRNRNWDVADLSLIHTNNIIYI